MLQKQLDSVNKAIVGIERRRTVLKNSAQPLGSGNSAVEFMHFDSEFDI
ncbi:hypothetical protein [Maridesulfovibrio sp.]|nr:hypothetical protein [Maridesulfovibrio sp.]